jgi:glucoamylase
MLHLERIWQQPDNGLWELRGEGRHFTHSRVMVWVAFNPRVGGFTQYYGGTELDAATLLIPAVGFLPGTDERVCATIDAIGRHLKHGDLIDR